jgi:hypothetical protein
LSPLYKIEITNTTTTTTTTMAAAATTATKPLPALDPLKLRRNVLTV